MHIVFTHTHSTADLPDTENEMLFEKHTYYLSKSQLVNSYVNMRFLKSFRRFKGLSIAAVLRITNNSYWRLTIPVF